MSNTPDTVSLSRGLMERTLAAIIKKLALKEDGADEGGVLRVLRGPVSPDPVGTVRRFLGEPLHHLVAVSIVHEPFQLDSHMLFAFHRAERALPHFTLDSVAVGEGYAFHLDLIPRLDLGASLAYMDAVLHPLSEAFESGRKLEGLSRAEISPRQAAVMSPWMLAFRANEAAFRAIEPTVQRYLEHWFSLDQDALPKDALAHTSAQALRERDARNKAMLFSPEVDPVWGRIAGLIGEDNGQFIRGLLQSQDD